MKEEVIMPAIVESLAKNLLDSQYNVWHRQPYREKLVTIKSFIEDVLRKYDVEYSKANRAPTRTQKKRMA
mgnify:CR=1 FL=1